MTGGTLFGLLARVPCGAFAVASDRTVVFWNARATELLGYSAAAALGRSCASVSRLVDGVGLTEDCADGCAVARAARVGLMPGAGRLLMRCASGELKAMAVTPMMVDGIEWGGPLLVYLFVVENDRLEPETVGDLLLQSGSVVALADDSWEMDLDEPAAPAPVAALTPRELDVLRLVALGWENAHIGERLGISVNTVRNQVVSLRRKLGASTRMEAAVVARRLGILTDD